MLQLHRIVKQKKDRNEYIPMHSHKYFHCIYGLSGEAMVQVENDSIIVSKGIFLRLCPNTPHAIYGVESFQSFDIKFSCSHGKTLGILGIGDIGKRVAKLAKAICMNVCAYDPAYTSARHGSAGHSLL